MNPHRTPWRPNFRDALILAGESDVKRHHAYPAAKTGDATAAVRLVRDLVSDDAIDALGRRFEGQRPIVASIHAQEGNGINEIPEALAVRMAQRLVWDTDPSLVQTNIVNHTGADGFSRLARQALFSGDVSRGAEYLIVDDFIGQGGTMANFRGHIEHGGASVIGAVALTGKPYSARLALSDQLLGELREKHGGLEDWWRNRFGFGYEALTQSEARYLARTAHADTISDRIAEAGQGQHSRHGQGAVGSDLD